MRGLSLCPCSCKREPKRTLIATVPGAGGAPAAMASLMGTPATLIRADLPLSPSIDLDDYDVIIFSAEIRAAASPETVTDPWWPLPASWKGRVIFEEDTTTFNGLFWFENNDRGTGMTFQQQVHNPGAYIYDTNHPLLDGVSSLEFSAIDNAISGGTGFIWKDPVTAVSFAENTIGNKSYVYHPSSASAQQTSGDFQQYYLNLKQKPV